MTENLDDSIGSPGPIPSKDPDERRGLWDEAARETKIFGKLNNFVCIVAKMASSLQHVLNFLRQR